MQAVEHIAGNGLADGRQGDAGNLPLNSGRHSSGQHITLADFAVVTSAGYVSEINAVYLGVFLRQRRGVDCAALGGGQHVAGAHLSGRAAGGHCRQLHTLFRRQLFGVGGGGHGAVRHRQLRGGRGGLRCRLNRSGSGCIGGGDRRVGDLLAGLADVADGLQHGNGGLVVNELGQQDTGGASASMVILSVSISMMGSSFSTWSPISFSQRIRRPSFMSMPAFGINISVI